MNEKKELQVAALRNGTVIDHIPSDKLFTVVAMLHLDEVTANITIGNNLESEKLGKKGIIKIADRFFSSEEINRLSVVAPNIVLNIKRQDGTHLFHFIEDKVEEDGNRTDVHLRLYHDAGGDVPAYTSRAYLSVPLQPYARKDGGITRVYFSLNTYEGATETYKFDYTPQS